jgi:lysophospholipase L1-like esterase
MKVLRKTLAIPLVFLVFYILLELVFYVSACYQITNKLNYFEAINQQNIVFDPIRGFKFLPGDARTALIINNQLEYHSYFHINNEGVPSTQDYFFEKEPGMRRYIVFGDSFTQGYFLEKNWPERVSNKLSEVGIELYNFSVDGGGLYNWHNILFKEVLPHYDFDGIIIASFGNDLDRDFFVMNPDYTLGKMYGGYLPVIPVSIEDLNENYTLDVGAGLYHSDETIDAKLQQLTQKSFQLAPLQSYLLQFLRSRIQNIRLSWSTWKETNKFNEKFLSQPTQAYNDSLFIQRYGEQKYDMLSAIITTSKELNKEVILVNIPDKESICARTTNIQNEFLVDSSVHILTQELQYFAKQYDVAYFNGYRIFDDVPVNELPSYWFTYDGHWNQKGSDLFGEKFEEFLREN